MRSMLWGAALALAVTVGCGSKDRDQEAPPAAEAPGDTTAKAPIAPPPPAKLSPQITEPVFDAYETARVALVADDTGPVAGAARQIADVAAAADLEGLAAAATALAKASPDDPNAVRVAFGELSKELIAILSKEPALAEELHVFECPMAEGYKRWLQRTDELANPYMGQSMPACGSEVALK